MTRPTDFSSGMETCLRAVPIWIAFFLITAIVQIVFPDTRIAQFVIVSAGALATGLIAYRWKRRANARQYLANLSLLMVGLFVGLDMAVAIFDL